MDAQELKNLNIAWIYHASTGQTLRERDVPEVTKFAEAVIKAAAERAVSPAESIDTLANGWPADFHKIIKGAEEAAHAEGRRSAMEELAKEKERADRAEATDAVRLITIYHHRKRIEELEAELAARQVPDLSDKHIEMHAVAWFNSGAHMVGGISVDKVGCFIEGAKHARALLAQPSQQPAPDIASLPRYSPTCTDGIAAMMQNPKGSYWLAKDVIAYLSNSSAPDLCAYPNCKCVGASRGDCKKSSQQEGV